MCQSNGRKAIMDCIKMKQMRFYINDILKLMLIDSENERTSSIQNITKYIMRQVYYIQYYTHVYILYIIYYEYILYKGYIYTVL